uniref:Uncharacterized protein n=1 Tax=Panagrolaimus sp. JU765 TaxID=591449 RepID=A0AC34RB21_9BILA
MKLLPLLFANLFVVVVAVVVGGGGHGGADGKATESQPSSIINLLAKLQRMKIPAVNSSNASTTVNSDGTNASTIVATKFRGRPRLKPFKKPTHATIAPTTAWTIPDDSSEETTMLPSQTTPVPLVEPFTPTTTSDDSESNESPTTAVMDSDGTVKSTTKPCKSNKTSALTSYEWDNSTTVLPSTNIVNSSSSTVDTSQDGLDPTTAADLNTSGFVSSTPPPIVHKVLAVPINEPNKSTDSPTDVMNSDVGKNGTTSHVVDDESSMETDDPELDKSGEDTSLDELDDSSTSGKDSDEVVAVSSKPDDVATILDVATSNETGSLSVANEGLNETNTTNSDELQFPTTSATKDDGPHPSTTASTSPDEANIDASPPLTGDEKADGTDAINSGGTQQTVVSTNHDDLNNVTSPPLLDDGSGNKTVVTNSDQSANPTTISDGSNTSPTDNSNSSVANVNNDPNEFNHTLDLPGSNSSMNATENPVESNNSTVDPQESSTTAPAADSSIVPPCKHNKPTQFFGNCRKNKTNDIGKTRPKNFPGLTTFPPNSHSTQKLPHVTPAPVEPLTTNNAVTFGQVHVFLVLFLGFVAF